MRAARFNKSSVETKWVSTWRVVGVKTSVFGG